jgi:hypothetical protein
MNGIKFRWYPSAFWDKMHWERCHSVAEFQLLEGGLERLDSEPLQDLRLHRDAPVVNMVFNLSYCAFCLSSSHPPTV